MPLLVILAGCPSKKQDGTPPSEQLRKPAPDQSIDDPRRLLFSQIVEDDEENVFKESAVIEGAPFKYFLHEVSKLTHDQIRKFTNEKLTFEELMAQPGLYRGQVLTRNRGIVLEVSQAELPPEYGLPPGYTVLPAVFIDSTRDVYALRILSPPGSQLYEKLQKGIAEDAHPVIRISGLFMKLYARQTGDPKEGPWRRPLLICPEPEFSQLVEPRSIRQELVDSHTEKLLGSRRIEAPGAEERLVIEMLPPLDGSTQARIRIGKKLLAGDMRAFVADAVRELKARLPQEQAGDPAAVVLVAAQAPRARLDEILAALRAAGVQRLAVKSE